MSASAVIDTWPYCVSSRAPYMEPPTMVPPVKRILRLLNLTLERDYVKFTYRIFGRVLFSPENLRPRRSLEEVVRVFTWLTVGAAHTKALATVTAATRDWTNFMILVFLDGNFTRDSRKLRARCQRRHSHLYTSSKSISTHSHTTIA